MREMLWFMLGAAVIGIILAMSDTELGAHRNSALVQHSCAHYDPKTGAFTWNDEAKP